MFQDSLAHALKTPFNQRYAREIFFWIQYKSLDKYLWGSTQNQGFESILNDFKEVIFFFLAIKDNSHLQSVYAK